MARTAAEQKKIIRNFVERWSGFHKEEEDGRSFLIELLHNILEVPNPTERLSFEKKVRIDGHSKKIDGYIPETNMLIEMKSSDVDLWKTGRKDYPTAYGQAKKYYDALKYYEKGRYLITSNFKTIEIFDMNSPEPEKHPDVIHLENLESEWHKLKIMINPDFQAREAERIKKEQAISVKAGELVGELYDLFLKQFISDPDDKQLKELNMLIVRIVFCLYAEDAGLFNDDQFHDFIKSYSSQNINRGLEDLFEVLDTPEKDRNPAYLDSELMAFPYVNGGLFAERIRIPKFNPEITKKIVEAMSEQFDWSNISPTIFGAVFESTLNPETRRSGGMHYTSVENIHKVIDPLFLNDLKEELEDIKSLKNKNQRIARAKLFQYKLSDLKFLDPACGSGNFLTESYLSLRKLENEALNLQLEGGIRVIDYGDEDDNKILVKIQQFYGIEINDFAVSVATTALYIAESQMFQETSQIVQGYFDFLPLKSYTNIKEGNALRMDWNDVVPNDEINYIMGNPPFVGASMMTSEQKKTIVDIFGNIKLVSSIDYVAGWYYKAAAYMYRTGIRAAFVSTNSITQGEQVAPIWGTLFTKFNIVIDFAYKTFIWNSDALDKAHVFCVIIGFSYGSNSKKKKIYSGDSVILAENINGYLMDAPSVEIQSRAKPICPVPKLTKGNQPSDGGNLILSPEDRNRILSKYPEASKMIREYLDARNFLNGNKHPRYCLWLRDIPFEEYIGIPEIKDRLRSVAEFRAKSTAKPTREKAKVPHLFFSAPQTEDTYLFIPRASSERREYIPMGFLPPSVIASDAASIVPNANLYHFGVLTSSIHMAWMRTVAGRLKGDYRYSGAVVYNNFPWPDPTPEQRSQIEQTAQAILEARKKYPDSSLAKLYDPIFMPLDLRKAHEANDKAVKDAYGLSDNLSESEIVAKLMKIYQQIIQKQI